MPEWLQELWDTLISVSLPLLVLGIAFQTPQTLLVALAWRNILRSAYPPAGVTYRPILSYYAGGNALNAILPASAGTVAMLGFFRTSIAGATVSGLVGATAVENIFFAAMAALIYGYLFFTAAGSFDFTFGWVEDHKTLTIVLVVGGAVIIAILLRRLWKRVKEQWENAKEGGAILREPRKFMTQVVGVEVLSYIARMGVNATFMKAFHIPVSIENVFLIVAASSISSTDRRRARARWARRRPWRRSCCRAWRRRARSAPTPSGSRSSRPPGTSPSGSSCWRARSAGRRRAGSCTCTTSKTPRKPTGRWRPTGSRHRTDHPHRRPEPEKKHRWSRRQPRGGQPPPEGEAPAPEA